MEIPRSLYESEWLSASIKYKKSMLMTMRKLTHKPFILTLGKFSPLTLDTLVMVRKGTNLSIFLNAFVLDFARILFSLCCVET